MANTGAHANFTGNSASDQAQVHSGHVFGNLTNNYGPGYQARTHNGDINHNYDARTIVQNGDISHNYAAGARIYNGNIQNNTTYNYTPRKRHSDDTLTESGRNKEFLKAAANGHTKRMEHLYSLGVDIDYTDEDEMTALHHAAFSGFEDTVDFLIDKGCGLDACSEDFGTPLCLAAVKNRVNVIGRLLANRANINSPGGQYGSPLHAACSTKSAYTIRILLGQGALVNDSRTTRSVDGTRLAWRLPGTASDLQFFLDCTPILLATVYGTPAIVSALINAGSSVVTPYRFWKSSATWEEAPDSERRCGCPPYFAKVDRERLKLLLDNGADPNATDNNGNTLLMWLANRPFDPDEEKNAVPSCAQELIRAGAKPEIRNHEGRTALWYASQHNKDRLLMKLLQAEEGICTQCTSYGSQTLHEASKHGHVSCIQRLIRAGVDMEARNEHGENALCISIRKGQRNAAAALLAGGANVDAQTASGTTALHLAARIGDGDAITQLLSFGADIQDMRTALHSAARNGYTGCVRELLRGGVEPDVRDNKESTPLHSAAGTRYPRITCIQELLKAGADIEARDCEGYTALHYAIEQGKGQIDCVRELLSAGADIEARTNDKHTALLLSAFNGRIACVRELIKARADMRVRDDVGRTALHAATEKDAVDCLKQLLRTNHIDIEARTTSEETSLHRAARFDSTACIRELIIAGADMRVRDDVGRTALHAAAERDAVDCLSELLRTNHIDIEARTTSGETALHRAAWYDSTACIRELIIAGADMRVRDNVGRTALHTATERDAVDCLSELLRTNHIDIEARTDSGNTALHLAALEGRTACIRKLLDVGAELGARNDDSFTPLHRAAIRGQVESIRTLIEAGAEMETRGPYGHTALHSAAHRGQIESMRTLLEAGANQNALTDSGKSTWGIIKRKGFLDRVGSLEHFFLRSPKPSVSSIRLQPKDGVERWPRQRSVQQGEPLAPQNGEPDSCPDQKEVSCLGPSVGTGSGCQLNSEDQESKKTQGRGSSSEKLDTKANRPQREKSDRISLRSEIKHGLNVWRSIRRDLLDAHDGDGDLPTIKELSREMKLRLDVDPR